MNPHPFTRLPCGAIVTESVNRAGVRATIMVKDRMVVIVPHVKRSK